MKSPLFECENVKNKELQWLDIDQSKSIRKVSFYHSNNWTYIQRMKLSDEHNQAIIDKTWCGDNDGNWATKDIPADKEIIGVFVNTTADVRITKIGFLVWTPNPQAK